jgi:hypothetical protein
VLIHRLQPSGLLPGSLMSATVTIIALVVAVVWLGGRSPIPMMQNDD